MNEDYESLKANFYRLKDTTDITITTLKAQLEKANDDYDNVVDMYNNLADKYNLLCKQNRIFENDNKKYRALYVAAKNKLECNDIKFNEYEIAKNFQGGEIETLPQATF